MNKDILYMRRCLQLAANGRNNVSPNPMVGAIIVCDDKIIGEGYHVRCGEAHAEVNAIQSVEDPSLLKRSTIYVSLEPCSHYGKTPPCADLIIEKGIPRVVVGCADPFIKVAGRGIRKLREAGIQVTVGVLEDECKKLISHFIVRNTQQRPYIILKWAESADGFLDITRTAGTPAKLSTALTGMLVHKRRAEADAILVGTQTAILDNPSLTVRNWAGKSPIRIVLDRNLVLPSSLHLFDGSTPTLVYTTQEHPDSKNIKYITLDAVSYSLPQIMGDLYQRGVQTLLVEGGSKVLSSFIKEGLWNEIFVEKSSKTLHSGVKAPEINNKISYSIEQHFGVFILHYLNPKA
ncbi:bifunctional diaminohydroxyphosphoribosylaminopyrimidine deaminase/5-amino-6-(5-phosphoribosylamino)uracil reductase RibD [Bacteroides sp. 224]|uniref:bifunctional diaminohydroxyphosphoribosylaminopyrimidine deaminase/5-amino-6-(5-phosphoribosylamino)uracil reductase RibD n=1 Tax=Bacteroides sp. 224 TaxID=2302936 RepID=UPI0013D490F5|nr:bifunctional diaminohydroxyphosphoribosylaminopyrimidine deaminase/5-amino-6-(5-phosphoribosylamino)uracil reductase RibD [Bacteroides sp. 224]NDV66388.1 bifunctional diaminohydroxyphosphoribosylaminopyrimidine deaminase/5-amino-6-(5-phosphoribosylamino)uracil reductase RibD [Bacteroides sp. 224]